MQANNQTAESTTDFNPAAQPTICRLKNHCIKGTLNMEIQETPTSTPRKPRLSYIVGGIILIVLLAGAAFVGARLINGQGLPFVSNGSGAGPSLSLGGPGGKMVKLDIEPSKELPQTPGDISGLFDHRQDNSIFVGTGKVTMAFKKDPSGKVETSSNHDGPTVEVVVTSQTKVYIDVTMRQFDGPPPEGQKIQQVLEPGSLDDVGQSSMITAWGKKTGDRFIAEILVYSPPAFIKK
jgi:hypothetical protein